MLMPRRWRTEIALGCLALVRPDPPDHGRLVRAERRDCLCRITISERHQMRAGSQRILVTLIQIKRL